MPPSRRWAGGCVAPRNRSARSVRCATSDAGQARRDRRNRGAAEREAQRKQKTGARGQIGDDACYRRPPSRLHAPRQKHEGFDRDQREDRVDRAPVNEIGRHRFQPCCGAPCRLAFRTACSIGRLASSASQRMSPTPDRAQATRRRGSIFARTG